MFHAFCNLSLTHRGGGFVTMLAPLRGYLRPKDPMASLLLRAAKEHYFERLSANVLPSEPGFDELQWIASEDVNVEDLLDVFTSFDADSEDVWAACGHLMDHLYWHKPRLVIFGSKIEALTDSHPFKPLGLMFLSRSFNRVGKVPEQKRMLIHCLGLWRERGDDFQVANTLIGLAGANREMGLCEEGIQQAIEASEGFGRLGETSRQAHCLGILALLLCQDKQLDAAEEAASRALNLSESQFQLSQCHAHLGEIHQSKGNIDS